MEAPLIVPITELRRQAASVIEQAHATSRPVFVTQHGFVTAVLMSRRTYDCLVHPYGGAGLAAMEAERSVSTPEDPLAVFGPLPDGTLFETKYGLVHADTAAFFLEEGLEVKPFIRRPGDGCSSGEDGPADADDDVSLLSD